MKTPTNPSFPDAEDRLEAWLASRPITPAPDFVARTLARIRAEKSLMAKAQAGDDAALETVLDRWLGEQPLEPDFDPAHLATQTLHSVDEEERDEAQPEESRWRRIVPFPAWARSSLAMAAAAAVVLLAFFATTAPTSNDGSNGGTGANMTASTGGPADDLNLSAPGDAATNPNALSQLNDQLQDGQALLDSDLVALLPGGEPSNDDSVQ